MKQLASPQISTDPPRSANNCISVATSSEWAREEDSLFACWTYLLLLGLCLPVNAVGLAILLYRPQRKGAMWQGIFEVRTPEQIFYDRFGPLLESLVFGCIGFIVAQVLVVCVIVLGREQPTRSTRIVGFLLLLAVLSVTWLGLIQSGYAAGYPPPIVQLIAFAVVSVLVALSKLLLDRTPDTIVWKPEYSEDPPTKTRTSLAFYILLTTIIAVSAAGASQRFTGELLGSLNDQTLAYASWSFVRSIRMQDLAAFWLMVFHQAFFALLVVYAAALLVLRSVGNWMGGILIACIAASLLAAGASQSLLGAAPADAATIKHFFFYVMGIAAGASFLFFALRLVGWRFETKSPHLVRLDD